MSVPGLQYVESLGFSYSNKWRNVGILVAFAVAYMLVGVVGSEIMHFTVQGGTPIVFTVKTKETTKDHLTDDVERSAAVQSQESGDASEAKAYKAGPALVWNNLIVHIGDKKILKGVSGFVCPGDFIALCGSSGAGKTTLLTHLSQTNGVGTLAGKLEFGNKPLGKYFKKISGMLGL